MKASHPHPIGHVLVPASAIGSLSILLVVGLSLLGLLERLNFTVAQIVAQGKFTSFPKALPVWSVWLVTVLLAFALSFAILSTPGTWRRLVIWITTLVLVAGWAPALGLAAHAPAIAGPFIGVLWSGVCAVVYAGKHRMPVDEISS
jgi:hypothetical protein